MEKLNEVKYDIGKFQEFVVDKKSLCFCLGFLSEKNHFDFRFILSLHFCMKNNQSSLRKTFESRTIFTQSQRLRKSF